MTLIEKIRDNLRLMMAEKELSMRALSLDAGLQEGAVKNIFNSVAASPGIHIMYKLADALNCSIDELCGRSYQQPKSPIYNKKLWRESIVRVDRLIIDSRKEITPEIRADLYLACYEFNTQGIEIKDYTQLNTILNFIKK